MKKIIVSIALVSAGIALASCLSSCEGRKADNMVPAGETVHVVIPEADVAQDSALAN